MVGMPGEVLEPTPEIIRSELGVEPGLEFSLSPSTCGGEPEQGIVHRLDRGEGHRRRSCQEEQACA